MAWEMPGQDLREVQRAHLPPEQGDLIDPLGDHHQGTLPQEGLGWLRQWPAQGIRLSPPGATWERA